MADEGGRGLTRSSLDDYSGRDRVRWLQAKDRVGELTVECSCAAYPGYGGGKIPSQRNDGPVKHSVCDEKGKVSALPLLVFLGLPEARVLRPQGVEGLENVAKRLRVKFESPPNEDQATAFHEILVRDMPFRTWLTFLFTRWPSVRVRAALAAARVVKCETCRGKGKDCSGCLFARRGVGAVEAWVDCPCEKHREECMRLMGITYPPTQGWIWHTLWGITEGASSHRTSFERAVQVAASTVGEDVVREAIQRELISWVLR